LENAYTFQRLEESYFNDSILQSQGEKKIGFCKIFLQAIIKTFHGNVEFFLLHNLAFLKQNGIPVFSHSNP